MGDSWTRRVKADTLSLRVPDFRMSDKKDLSELDNEGCDSAAVFSLSNNSLACWNLAETWVSDNGTEGSGVPFNGGSWIACQCGTGSMSYAREQVSDTWSTVPKQIVKM